MPQPPKDDSNTSLKELKQSVENFCSARGWKNQDPRQLLISTQIELAELMEYFQWTKGKDWTPIKKKQKEVAFELVDIFFYLLRFLTKSKIDFSKHFYEKLKKLEKKYPPGKHDQNFYNQQKTHYRLTGKNATYD